MISNCILRGFKLCHLKEWTLPSCVNFKKCSSTFISNYLQDIFQDRWKLQFITVLASGDQDRVLFCAEAVYKAQAETSEILGH